MNTVTWSLSGILQIMYIQVVLGNGCQNSQEKCCTLCNPGYRLINTCGKCVQCPREGYQDQPNNLPHCKLCAHCEGVFQYKEKCTSTKNAVCTCVPGRKCVDEKCTQCINDSCPAGQQLHGQKCINCPAGTFNSGAQAKCTSWTNCSALGRLFKTNGSHTSDVVCGDLINVEPSTTPSMVTTSTEIKESVRPPENDRLVVYTVVSGAVCLLLIAICVTCRKKLTEKIKHMYLKIPKPIVKQTEQEESCSVHFPEEENGGENEPMTLEA